MKYIKCLYKIRKWKVKRNWDKLIWKIARYYFNDIINGTDINVSNILLDKKLYKNISVYEISYKTQIGPKPSRIRFDKIDGLVMVLDGKIKHLVVFDYELINNI